MLALNICNILYSYICLANMNPFGWCQSQLSSLRLREASLNVVILNFGLYVVFYYVSVRDGGAFTLQFFCGRQKTSFRSLFPPFTLVSWNLIHNIIHPQKAPSPRYQCLIQLPLFVRWTLLRPTLWRQMRPSFLIFTLSPCLPSFSTHVSFTTL